ncbi:Nucleic acid-binding [Forsythia ovata]|uniref:Nucleic acid-binding n=1 Tax=Forsythia ovata TaxID=205694 RepID=A0ABD1QAD4_9LAMI
MVVKEKFNGKKWVGALASMVKSIGNSEFTVQATLYDQNIIVFQDKLILGKTYVISNALVKITSSNYKAKSVDVQWTIPRITRIQLIEDVDISEAYTNAEAIDEIIAEKHYLSLTHSKLSAPNESKFTEIKSI